MVIVTGATGHIGNVLVRQLLASNEKVRAIIPPAEDIAPLEGLRAEIVEGDVCDINSLIQAFKDSDIVYHLAGIISILPGRDRLLHQVNVIGTQNIIEVAFDQQVSRVVNISTDKACSPASTLGATKLLAERLITATNYYRGFKETIFSSVRFGNVLDSRGSVVPVFRKQIQDGGPVTITDPEMTIVPGVRVEGPIDETGAGDSATAGAVLALASGATLPEAALIGNLVASITIQQLATTGTARPEQLPERLEMWQRQRT